MGFGLPDSAGQRPMSTSYPLITTKIRTPRLRQTHLRRERLLNHLHNSIQNKLILIAAGAGYGKTSLLIDYAHDTDLPVCWYSLDAHDAHVPTFVEYLVESIQQRFPQFGEPVRELLRAHGGPPEDVEPFVRVLISEIEHTINTYFVLILDDYHEVIESEPVNALVDGLLRYIPEQCHVILASRGIPRRLTLTRLAARQEVVGLGVEHLRFTADEIGALLRSLGRLDLSEAQIATLAERSEGWITGVLLAAQASWSGATHDILQLTGATGGVFDFMAEEILGRQPPELQRFLKGSALYNAMTPPLCDALLEITNSADLLRRLSEENLFTFPLDAEGTWYQYHQLFREFLVTKLEQDDPDAYRQLCLRQAELLAHRGNWQRAIDGYIAARAHGEAADAIEIVAQETFDAGNWDALRSWIDALPGEILAAHPRLLVFRAKLHVETGALYEAAPLLERAYSVYHERGDSLGAARALIQTATLQRLRGRLRDAIQTSREALEMVAGSDALASILARRCIGICQVMLGHLSEGIDELRRALTLAESSTDDMNAAHVTHDLGSAEVMRGELVSARQYYHQALMYWRKVGNASALASTLQCLGVVHHYLGQYTEAENRFEEGLSKAREVADARIEAYALASQGDLYRDTARQDDALQRYELALQITSRAQNDRLTIYLLDAMGNAHRLKGDLRRARQFLTEAADLVRADEMDFELGLCRLSGGALALSEGEWASARPLLEEARDLLAGCEARRDLARAHLHLAALAHHEGDSAAMRADLEEVARLAAELGSHQVVVAEGLAHPDVLRGGEALGIAGLDLMRVRIEMAQLAPSAVPEVRIVASARPALEFLALNGGQVLKGGQLVTDWESASARMLAFLFLSHPQGLRRDRVIDLLWPDVSQERGNSLFHSTTYRLRSALYKDTIVHENGLYRINPASAYRYDVSEFERLVQIGRESGEVAHQARVHAIDLYHTPFLESFEEEWCAEIRQALQRDVVELLLREARFVAAEGEAPSAERHYLRALAFDAYDERAHRGIMWCRAAGNDRAGAMRQYRECARILADELGVEPSLETDGLYEAIVAGGAPPVPV